MRVSRVQHAKNRQEVIAAAGKLLLERGIEGIGVDALAKAAGMTHGAVYSHFGSKEDLAAAAIRESLTEFRERWIADAGGDGAPDLFNRLVRSYVSPSHRDNPGMGCALAAMGPDAIRHGQAVQQAFSDSTLAMIDVMTRARAGETEEARRDEAIVTIATMIGAVVLPRAVKVRTLSDRILAVVRKWGWCSLGRTGRSRSSSPATLSSGFEAIAESWRDIDARDPSKDDAPLRES
jgi:TetR/AcrR family transcriptional repressor of nem operon